MRYRLNSVPIEQFNAAVRQLDSAKAEVARLTAEITTLRARLETVEAETIERAVKRIKADKDIQGLIKARIFIALRNLEPRHD